MSQYRNMPEALNLRLPSGMRDRIKVAAALNRRSMNAEVVFRLERFEALGADAAHPIQDNKIEQVAS